LDSKGWGMSGGLLRPNTRRHRRSFDHPFFQSSTMFIGEALCLLAFVIKRKMSAEPEEKKHPVCGNSIYFSLPAILDMCGTSVMTAGLCLTYTSVFQMLRSAVVVFTALMSVFILKRKLYVFHWVSIFFVCLGVFVVGYVSIAESDDSSSASKPASSVMLGNFLVIFAQAMVAFQMVIEERIISKYGAPALKAVGFEGVFGFLILSVMMVPLYYIQVSGGERDYPLEDAIDALEQVKNSTELQVSLLGYICSIAFFNFFGISVTKAMSASHRMVLDSLRTVAVLVISVMLGWETFHPKQLIGFFFLLLGTGMYNEIVRVPALFSYPEDDDSSARSSFVEATGRFDSKDDGAESKNINEPLLANV